MKISYNNVEYNANELQVDRYYKHVKSNTLWKIHSISSTPIGVALDIELVNEYGDVKNVEVSTNISRVFAVEGEFIEISREEFEKRKML